MAIDVYLSAGKPANAEQENFLQAVERFLRQHDLNPRTPGRTHLANKQPLKAVEQCMRSCKGIVVVAYERLYAPVAIERRGGPEQKGLEDAIVPTVWNQVEGAMAYTLGLPVLIIAQKGLRSEALLESKYDWNVQWVDVDARSLLTPDFVSVFEDWRKEIDAAEQSRAAKPPSVAAPAPRSDTPETKTVAQLIGELKPGQAMTVATILFGLISGAFGLGRELGKATAPRAPTPQPSVQSSVPTSALASAPSASWLSDTGAVALLGGRAVLRVDSTSATGRWAALTLTVDGNPGAALVPSGGSHSFLVDGRKHVLTVMRVEPRRVAYNLVEAR